MKRHYMFMVLCVLSTFLYSADELKQVIFIIGNQRVPTDLYIRHYVEEGYIDINLESLKADAVSDEQLYACANKLKDLFHPEKLELISSTTVKPSMQRIGLCMDNGGIVPTDCFIKGYYSYAIDRQLPWGFEKIIHVALPTFSDELKKQLLELFRPNYVHKLAGSRFMLLDLCKLVSQSFVDSLLNEHTISRLIVAKQQFKESLNQSVLLNFSFAQGFSQFLFEKNAQEINQKELPEACKLYLQYARVFEDPKL